MSGFLYFIPTDRPMASREMIVDAGLGYVLDSDGSPTSVGVTGPNGAAGVVFSSNKIVGYHADKQTWLAGPGACYHVGRENASSIRPEDLQRTKVYQGEAVKLADGNEWTIPRALSQIRIATLPQLLKLTDDCIKWTTEVLPEFASITADAALFWKNVTGTSAGESFEMEFQELIRIGVAALAINHRVGPIEVSMLNLLTTENCWRVAEALVDVPEIQRAAAAVAAEPAES